MTLNYAYAYSEKAYVQKQFKYKEAIDNFFWQKKRAQKKNTDFIISKIFDCSLKV
jgi:hypothetical protein